MPSIVPPDRKSNITATYSYDEGTLVTLAFFGDGAYHFHKRAIGVDGLVDSTEDERDLSADASSFGKAVDESASNPPTTMSRGMAADHYPNGVREAVRVLRGEKKSDISNEQMIRTIQACAAIEESLKSGSWINPSEL
jgi:predicted dehydrogenase